MSKRRNMFVFSFIFAAIAFAAMYSITAGTFLYHKGIQLIPFVTMMCFASMCFLFLGLLVKKQPWRPRWTLQQAATDRQIRLRFEENADPLGLAGMSRAEQLAFLREIRMELFSDHSRWWSITTEMLLHPDWVETNNEGQTVSLRAAA